MEYIKTITDNFGKDYQEQLSNKIITQMNKAFDYDKVLADKNAELKADFDKQVASMTADEKEVAGELVAPEVLLGTDEQKFGFAFSSLKAIGKTIVHEINAAGVITIWIYKLESEVKVQTKATFDISLTDIVWQK